MSWSSRLALRGLAALLCVGGWSLAQAQLVVDDEIERIWFDQRAKATSAVDRAAAALDVISRPALPLGMGQRATNLVQTAMNYVGVPYRRGGTTEDGFDCSGFTQRMFEMSLGVALPRLAVDQAHAHNLTSIKRDELAAGDLVFFTTKRKHTFSHVGIYLGDGMFIHAPKPGAEVRVESMRGKYWSSRFTGGRRASGLQVTDQQGSTPLAVGSYELIKN